MLQQNIAPSLRQSMINEALDYHQNMNSVVFKRQARNLETYARESGRTDPSPKDVLVEGSIRQKVAEIGTQIQRLNQQLNYAGNTVAPAVGSGGRRGKVSKARRAARRNPTGLEIVPQEQPSIYTPGVHGAQREMEDWQQRHLVPLEQEEHEFQDPLEISDPSSSNPRVIQDLDIANYYRNHLRDVPVTTPYGSFNTSIVPYQSNLGAPEVGESSDEHSEGSEGEAEGEPGGFPFFSEGTVMPYVRPQQDYETPQTAEVTSSGTVGSPSFPQQVERRSIRIEPADEGSIGSRPSGIPSEFGQSDYSVPSSQQHGTLLPSRVGSFISEPNAPGPTITSSPSAVDSSKLNIAIDSSLAGIVASYNSLMDFIDLQQKQRSFNQQDEQLVSQLLKELVEPLKMLIANSAVAKQGTSRNLVDYTRIYNVISALINKITSSPPFFKVPPGILTEKIPIREDIIQAENYNPEKQANHAYLEGLVKKIQSEFDAVIRTSPKSPLEKEARELKLKELQAAYSKITKAGYRESSEILKDVSAHKELVKDKEFMQRSAQQQQEANEGKLQDYEDIEQRHQQVTEEVEDNLRRLQRINQKLEQDIGVIQDLHHDWEATGEQQQFYLHNLQQARSDEEAEGIEANIAHIRRIRDEIVREITDINQGISELDEMQRHIHQRLDGAAYVLEHTRLSEDSRNQLRQDLDMSIDLFEELAQREQDIRQSISSNFPKLSKLKPEVLKSIKKYHKGHVEKQAAEKEKRFRLNQQAKSKYKGEFPTFLGDGMPSRSSSEDSPKASSDGKKTGGHVHKKSADPFGDNSELAPYLTKYLRPSKHRQKVPEIASSSEESSGEEDGEPIRKKVGQGKKKLAKAVEDFEIIVSAPKADKGFLLAKKTPKRTGGKKKISKPVHETSPVQDLWFM